MEAKDNKGFGDFFYFGLKDKLERIVNPQYHPSNIIELISNIDSFSPFNSSPLQIWPILCKIYSREDVYKPFSVAVYAGKSKPKDSNQYLKQFAEELNNILTTGIISGDLNIAVKVKYFVCDRPARAFIKNIVGHTAAHSCERCTVTGKKHDGVMVFLDLDAEKRTDSSFRRFSQPDYHVGPCILCQIKPPLNMISTFVIDTMHLLWSGVTNRSLEYLLQPSTRKWRLSADMKNELQKRTKMIECCIPDEFTRKMRPIEDYKNYKATELKFFLLYAAPVVMKNVLSKEMYQHLMLLALPCRLLSGVHRLKYINQCRRDLHQFVEEASKEERYGPSFVSLNVHDLVHLCDDIETSGCDLNELSAFPFESHLGIVSRSIRSPLNVVAQYCNRVKEKEKFSKIVVRAQVDIQILKQTKTNILSIKYKNLILSTTKPNNTVLLNDGRVGVINKILVDKVEVKIIIKKIL